MKAAVRFVCAAWIVPSLLLLVVFFGFATNYTTDVFSRPGILARYETGVFRFRVLGRALLLEVAERLEALPIAYPVPRALYLMDPAAVAAVYWAYVITYVCFTGIGCSILLWLLRRMMPGQAPAEPEMTVVAIAMFVALTTFVVTPYDALFFAFFSAALALVLYPDPARAIVPLALTTVLAALTRETAYFIPAFVLAVHGRAILAGDRAARALFVTSVGAFAVTYAALRAVFGLQSSVYYAAQWYWNLKWTSLSGLIGLGAALLLLMSGERNVRAIRWYVALSIPYILFVCAFAETWELRLWVPIVVPLIVLRVVQLEPRADSVAEG